jgi:hypothetical protein
MLNWGYVPVGSVLPFPFASYGKTSGASITLTGLAVTDIEVYKGTSAVQRASDAGYALLDSDGIDVDGITGVHGFSIDTGNNSDAGFYAVGAFYYVVVSSVTVDGETVNFVAGSFGLIAELQTAPLLTATELSQLRGRLGIEGTSSASSATPSLAAASNVADLASDINAIQAIVDKLNSMLEASGVNFRFTVDALSVAATTTQVADEVRTRLQLTLPGTLPADGTRPSIEQAIHAIYCLLTEREVVGNELRIKNVDGTLLMTIQLNSTTTPSSQTRIPNP